MTDQAILLSVEHLSIQFGHAHLNRGEVVHDISFQVNAGEKLALVGESGSGKSVTALSILHLHDRGHVSYPSGAIYFDGADLLKHDERTMRGIRGKDIAMIFQEPMTALNPVYTIGEQLIEPLVVHEGMGKAAARQRMLELLDRTGIPEPHKRFDAYPHMLSGGQRQRVMIAMALACSPKLLIADEPTTALDVTIQLQILNLLEDLQRDFSMAVLMITHDLNMVRRFADRICVMQQGHLVEQATVNDLFAAPQHPYTRFLLNSEPTRLLADEKAADMAVLAHPATCMEAPVSRESEVRGSGMPGATTHPWASSATAPGVALPPASAVHGCTSAAMAGCQGAAMQSCPVESRPALMQANKLKCYFPVKAGFFRHKVGEIKAVDSMDITLRQGETLGIVGESGSGKSTLGMCLLRLQECEGEIVFDGQRLDTVNSRQLRLLRRDFQVVFQDPYSSLSPRMTVEQIISEGLQVHFPLLTKAQRRERIVKVLKEVGLSEDMLSRYPHEFSGGQRQRIAIARVVVLEPKLILLDEPTSALDVSVQKQVLELLRSFQVKLGISYLFITHDLKVIRAMAHRVLVMRGGSVVESGDTEQLFTAPQHEYTRTLLHASLFNLETAPGNETGGSRRSV